MKRLFLTLVLLTSTAAFAHQHGYWRPGGGGGWNWVAPVIVGGVVGYELARPPQQVIIQQPAQQPYIVPGQNCSPWTQIQNPDGSITTTRTCQ